MLTWKKILKSMHVGQEWNTNESSGKSNQLLFWDLPRKPGGLDVLLWWVQGTEINSELPEGGNQPRRRPPTEAGTPGGFILGQREGEMSPLHRRRPQGTSWGHQELDLGAGWTHGKKSVENGKYNSAQGRHRWGRSKFQSGKTLKGWVQFKGMPGWELTYSDPIPGLQAEANAKPVWKKVTSATVSKNSHRTSHRQNEHFTNQNHEMPEWKDKAQTGKIAVTHWQGFPPKISIQTATNQ